MKTPPQRPHPATRQSPYVCAPQQWRPDTIRSLPIRPLNASEVNDHAINSTPRSSHRGGRTTVAGESLHSHAGIHPVNFERRRGHCSRPMAPECLWSFSFDIPDPCWNLTLTVAHPSTARTLNGGPIRPTRQESASRRDLENQIIISRRYRDEFDSICSN